MSAPSKNAVPEEMSIDDLLVLNARRFTPAAPHFEGNRPTPPNEVCTIVQKLSPSLVPNHVVDLGCGTGLSMVPWLDKARIVVGVEPNGEMLRRAQERSKSYSGGTTIALRHSYSDNTEVDSRWANVVTCSQSLHWMEPESTYQEIGRILKPGGIFVAYDCDWPPTSTWEVSYAWQELLSNVQAAESRLGEGLMIRHWGKDSHLHRMDQSGVFRFTTETVLHHTEPANADRHLGIALSMVRIQNLFTNGVRERDIGLFDFFRTLEGILGRRKREINFCYRIRIGVR